MCPGGRAQLMRFEGLADLEVRGQLSHGATLCRQDAKVNASEAWLIGGSERQNFPRSMSKISITNVLGAP